MMIQLTRWLYPTTKFNSQYGFITNADWLLKEKERIEKDPRRKAEIRQRGKLVSLYVNDVTKKRGRWK